jgi:hypothetical protein
MPQHTETLKNNASIRAITNRNNKKEPRCVYSRTETIKCFGAVSSRFFDELRLRLFATTLPLSGRVFATIRQPFRQFRQPVSKGNVIQQSEIRLTQQQS